MVNESDNLLRHYSQPILKFLDDPAVTEVCIPRFDQIEVERNGMLELTDAAWENEYDFVSWIKQVALSLGQEVDEQRQPLIDARLPDGTRFNAALRPVSVLGPNATLRPYPKKLHTMDDLIGFGALTEDMKKIAVHAILARLNLLMSGGTGSGKTSGLRAMCSFIPHDERLLTVEDTNENLLPDHPHKVYYEAPKRKVEAGIQPITMGRLIENTLRGRPDRVIVGEIRNPEAGGAFVEAINTGHGGAQATIHANDALDALFRLEILYARQAMNMTMELIQPIVRRNIDLVVHASRIIDGKKRLRVWKEMLWLENGQPVMLAEYRKRDGFILHEAACSRFMESTADH